MSNTTIVPPAELPPTPPISGHGESSPTTSKVVAVLVVSLGVLIAVGTIVGAVTSTIASAMVRTETRTLAITGVDALDVEVAAGTLDIAFGDVTEATLSVTGSRGADAWTYDRDGDSIVVSSPDSSFWDFGWFSGDSRATLTLPESLERQSLDGDLQLSAGDLSVDGRFGDLDIEVNAGALDVDGTARGLDVDVNAGRAELDVAGVDEANFSVSAGAVEATLTDRAPGAVGIDVSAGSVDLTLPQGEYDVRPVDISGGDLDNRVTTSSTSSNMVVVQVSAGSVTLREAP